MATATALRVEPAGEIKTSMLTFLQGLHERWLREVRSVVDPAIQPESGAWMRWHAVHYIESGFARRFERERRAVMNLHARLTPDQATHLWAGGELVAQLVARTSQAPGLCHRLDEFMAMAVTFLAALEYWCRLVEETLGPVRWGEIPPDARHLFEVISEDELVESC